MAPWRERFRAMGVSGKEYPSSVEALLRRAMKGGEPVRVNPLVDFYNTISLRHVVPVGGYDVAGLRGPLELRLSAQGDRFEALDADAAVAVPAGEVVYAHGHDVLTRHFVWRQARAGLISRGTGRVFLVSEILSEIGEAVSDAVRDDLRTGLTMYFGAQPRIVCLDRADGGFSW